ncbi:UNVERIFIED_CONTAM: hypothetical protein FKN15_045330 [Acipenser sinensis]
MLVCALHCFDWAVPVNPTLTPRVEGCPQRALWSEVCRTNDGKDRTPVYQTRLDGVQIVRMRGQQRVTADKLAVYTSMRKPVPKWSRDKLVSELKKSSAFLLKEELQLSPGDETLQPHSGSRTWVAAGLLSLTLEVGAMGSLPVVVQVGVMGSLLLAVEAGATGSLPPSLEPGVALPRSLEIGVALPRSLEIGVALPRSLETGASLSWALDTWASPSWTLEMLAYSS